MTSPTLAAKDAGALSVPIAAPHSEPDAGTALGAADAVAAKVDAVFLGRKTFSARFKQEHTQKVSGQVKRSTGVLLVEKPNKISFRYDAPSTNRIVSNGVTLKIYVGEDAQMFETPEGKTEYPGALSFLMGNGMGSSFSFSFNEQVKFDGGPVLVGRPRRPDPAYEIVSFYIDNALLAKGDPGVVRRVLIVDTQGNRNRFDFEGASQPASIDPGEFVFTPPAGTTITR